MGPVPCQSERMTDPTHPAASDQPRWPSDPALLVDTTRCPACFSPLRRAACDVCGLRLDVPAAMELLAAGARVRDAEVDRQEIIIRMRGQQVLSEARSAPPAPSVPTVPVPPPLPPATTQAPASVPGPPSAPVPLGPVPVVPASAAAPHPAAPAAAHGLADAVAPARPRRSGVQLLLLTLGVVLLSVAAIVFLLVAYLVATLEVRSIVTAIASVLVLALAWLLRTRGLPGTAEGVASFAVVLLVLDAWIVRENDLFGSDLLDAADYWGGALLLLAAFLAGARLVSRVRATGIASAVLAPVGLSVLAYGAAPDEETGTGLWLGGIVVLLAAAGIRFARPSIERTIVLSLGFAGGMIAFVGGVFALPDVDWGSTWDLLAVAVGWIVLLVALRLRTDAWTRAASLAAVVAGLAAAIGPGVGAASELDLPDATWIAPASAGAVACLAATATRARGRWARDGIPAFVAASSVALLAVLPAVVTAISLLQELLSTALSAWSLDASAIRESDLGDPAGIVLAPLALGVLGVVALVLLGRLGGFGAIPASLLLGAGVAVAAMAPTLSGSVSALLAIAVLALALSTLPMTRRVRGLVVVLAVFGMASAAGAWAVAHGSSALWWWTVPLVVALAVAGRLLAPRVWPSEAAPELGALHLAVAAVVTVMGAVMLPAWSDVADRPFVEPWDSGAFVAALGAALILGVLAFASRVTPWDRLAIAIPLFTAALLGSFALTPWIAVTPSGWIPALALALVGLAWLRSPVTSLRVAFAASTPFALACAGAGLLAEVGDVDLVVHGLAGAALLAAVLAHVVTPRGSTTRVAWSIAVGFVAMTSLVMSLLPPAAPDQTWLVLMVLVPVPVIVAALDGDPVGGTAPTRHLSWVSLALLVGAVWAWLAADDVQDVEAYTLPLAGALLVAGVLIMWRRATPVSTAAGRTAVLGAAAAVAVLPSVAQAGDSELRTLILSATGSVVVLAGLFLPADVRGVPIRLLVVTTGWTAITGAAIVRGTAVALDEPSLLVTEFWPLVALAVGVTAAVAWARMAARPAAIAEWGLAASVALAAAPTVVAIQDGDDPTLRAALLFPLLAAVHIAAVALRIRPVAGPAVEWTSLGAMVLAGALVLVSGRVDPFELVTVPIGTALVVAGGIRMRRAPALRSWRALGPGLAVALVPSLIADWTDPELWRLVALGVASVSVVVVGAVLRLQAPVVLGGAVLLTHAITQLWPWISRQYEADWWWLWLGIAGALLVTIAATYERQVRFARGAVRTVASLR